MRCALRVAYAEMTNFGPIICWLPERRELSADFQMKRCPRWLYTSTHSSRRRIPSNMDSASTVIQTVGPNLVEAGFLERKCATSRRRGLRHLSSRSAPGAKTVDVDSGGAGIALRTATARPLFRCPARFPIDPNAHQIAWEIPERACASGKPVIFGFPDPGAADFVRHEGLDVVEDVPGPDPNKPDAVLLKRKTGNLPVPNHDMALRHVHCSSAGKKRRHR